jgi:hypothetical protein
MEKMAMKTKLHELFKVLAVVACLGSGAIAGGQALADWPGDIGPKQQALLSAAVDTDFAE